MPPDLAPPLHEAWTELVARVGELAGSRLLVAPGTSERCGPDGHWSPVRLPPAIEAAAAQLRAAVPAHGLQADGVVAQAVDAALVLVRGAKVATDVQLPPPDASPTCWALLDAALTLGRNVLLVGPAGACVPVAQALLLGGARPAVLAGRAPAGAAPPWLHAADLSAAQQLGCDRLGAYGLPPAAVVASLQQGLGVVGHLEAHGVAHGLMRFEAATAPGRDAALAVLAGVDLVVHLVQRPTLQVREVAEVVLTDAGYRPMPLLARAPGHAEAPLRGVAGRLPSFAAELLAAGHGELLAQLGPHAAAALGQVGPDAAGEGAHPSELAAAPQAFDALDDLDDLDGSGAPWDTGAGADAPPAALPRPRPAAAAGQRAASLRAPSRRPSPSTPALADAPGDYALAPGWELDTQPTAADVADPDVAADDLAAEPAAPQADAALSSAASQQLASHAAMAASFGLAPPPRPSAAAPVLAVPPPAASDAETPPER